MAIERLISAYRRDDFADAKGFTVQLGTILEAYPDHIVEWVTHPLTGVQRHCKFPPSLADVVEACEARQNRLASEAAAAELLARQQQEREDETRRRERKQAALCHLWMRADPPNDDEVARYPAHVQDQAQRMPLSEVLQIIPSARQRFVRPIEGCAPFPPRYPTEGVAF